MGQSTAPTTPIEMEEENPAELMRQAMAEIAITWGYL